MAESVVSLVVDRLVPFIIEEAKLLKGVHREVKSIKDEMDYVRVFLRDADAKAETDEQVKIWVKQVRQVAFRMEDVLDEFRLRLAQKTHGHPGFGGRFIRKTFGFSKQLKPRHVIASEIREIKISLDQINQRRDRYQFNRSDTESEQACWSSNAISAWHCHRDDALYVEESELVSFEKPRNELVNWLVEGETRRTVFAVVGTGGVGKTTLVRKVYECLRVKSHFHCYAWITVSPSFVIEELLVRLLKQFHESRKESVPQGIGTMERTQLIDILRDFLQEMRYVVILDDVWSIDMWKSLKHALLDNGCGSRIVVTTRTNDVACFSVESSSHIYNLSPLPLGDALVLFYKKAFGSNSEGQCPPELRKLSKKIVKRSGGLPLAIVALAGLLLTKEKTVLEWKKFHDSLSSKLREDPNLKSIMKIISLSYHDLPYYLKSCFLYFGVFPRDYLVLSRKLIWLWIAEGFVKEKKGKTLEDVGQDYLDQLISRSLVHVDKYSGFGHERICRVHDLMLEFIFSRFMEEDFCEILDKKSNRSSNESSRRLSIQNGTGGQNIMESTNSSSLTRSLLVFQSDKMPSYFMSTLLSSFVLLKILDLGGAPLQEFPRDIANMFHLRYLDLSNTLIKMLPKTLEKLQNLETLYLARTCVVELPVAILKLRKLRHLVAYHRQEDPSTSSMSKATKMSEGCLFHLVACHKQEVPYSPSVSKAVKLPKGIGCLTALQTLTFVDVNRSTNIMTDLEKLTDLRELSIMNLRKENGTELCTSIAKMKHLLSLNVDSLEEEEVLDLQFVSSPPSFLQELFLSGCLEKLPHWITSLSNLIKISLMLSRLRDDPMEVLRGLPNLLEINLLHHAYDGEQLHLQAESFQKLKILGLFNLDRLCSVIMETGTTPLLHDIHIEKCEQLKEVPIGITYLSNLESLSFYNMPDDFTRRLAKDGGEDYTKVKHIPLVYFD